MFYVFHAFCRGYAECEDIHLIRITSWFKVFSTRFELMGKNHIAIEYPRGISIESNETIENILKNSATRFVETGLEDLAQKWETILDNYRISTAH